MKGRVIQVCISPNRGVKKPVEEAKALAEMGFAGDYHAKGGVRQVSLLASESIQVVRERGLTLDHGCFGENIVSQGVDLKGIAVGTRIRVGEVLLEVSAVGKDCPEPCEIGRTVGECIMPSEGVFAVVCEGGFIRRGDEIMFEEEWI
ncbi:MAG: MOSC domain-containing protein [Candidatus Altiarchaeota archaeon]